MIIADFLRSMESKIYVGLGYIIVPPDVDKDKFIANCYSQEEVSIYPDTGGISYNKVKITPDALQNIEFPEEEGSFGSMVLYFLHPVLRYPIVFGVLDKANECKFLKWKQFKFSKTYKNSEVTIVGDAAKSSLQFKIKGGNGQNGLFTIIVQDPENKGKLNLRVQGDIKLFCSTFSILSKDLELITQNSVKIINNSFEIKTLNFIIDCLEERNDKFKEPIPEDPGLEVGSLKLKAKILDIVVGQTTIHIEDTDGDNPKPLITINGGSLEGLINIKQQEEKLNKLVEEVNKAIDTFNTHVHPGTISGTSVTIGTTTSSASKATKFDKSDYEDTTVIH